MMVIVILVKVASLTSAYILLGDIMQQRHGEQPMTYDAGTQMISSQLPDTSVERESKTHCSKM